MPDPNPISRAVVALEVGREFSAMRNLVLLDHEAAVEEWRCPKNCAEAHHFRRLHPSGGGLPNDKRTCGRCGADMYRVLVVPYRSEGGDHADA